MSLVLVLLVGLGSLWAEQSNFYLIGVVYTIIHMYVCIIMCVVFYAQFV